MELIAIATCAILNARFNGIASSKVLFHREKAAASRSTSHFGEEEEDDTCSVGPIVG